MTIKFASEEWSIKSSRNLQLRSDLGCIEIRSDSVLQFFKH